MTFVSAMFNVCLTSLLFRRQLEMVLAFPSPGQQCQSTEDNNDDVTVGFIFTLLFW